MNQELFSKNFKVHTASAGSGKTFKLTVDYLKIALTDPENKFKRILAITFTVKATNEMKARILEACQAFSQLQIKPLTGRNLALFQALEKEVDFSEEEIAERSKILYKKILHNYSDFGVSTIDSFSQRILRSFAFELAIPMNFEVQIDQSQIIDIISARLLEKVGLEKEITTLLTKMFKANLIEKDSTRFLPIVVDASEVMLKEESQHVVHEMSERVSLKEILLAEKHITSKYSQAKKSVIEIGQKAFQLIQDSDAELSYFTRNCGNFFLKIQGDFKTSISKSFLNAVSDSEKWFTAKSKYKNPSLGQSLSLYGEKLLQAIEHYRAVEIVFKAFPKVALIAELHSIYKQYQIEEDCLLISEFNALINEQVKEQPAPFLFEKVGELYENILIDEFQDTSVVQFHNLLPMLTEAITKENVGDSLIVGDSKQAIYRFRGGETTQLSLLPEVINENNDSIIAENAAILERRIEKVPMEMNYRSNQVIVDFNNSLYGFIAGHSELQEYFPIYSTYFQHPIKKNNKGFVSIEVLEKPGKNEEETYDDLVAELFLEQMNSIKDRGYNMSDVAILCRYKTDLNKLSTLLLENGYQIESQESLALVNKRFVNLYISIVELLYDASNQIKQAEVLNGFIAYDLLPISNHELNIALGKANLKTISQIEAFIASYNSTIELKGFSKTDLLELYEQYVSWLPKEIQASDYLSTLRNQVVEFVTKNGNNIEGFLDFWAQKADGLFVKSGENKDAVKLMTIHKSKGLEFEVVMMPYSDWRFSYHSETKWVKIEEYSEHVQDYYVELPKNRKETILRDDVIQAHSSLLLDNLNLLYVATTRAVSELYIITPLVSKKKNIEDVSNMDYLLNEFTEGTSISYGVPLEIEADEEEENNIQQFKLNHLTNQFGQAEVVVKNRSNAIWSERVREKIDYGEVIHALFEKINHENDIDSTLYQALADGLINEQQREELAPMILSIIQQPEIQEFFLPNATVLAEQSILTPSGQEFIPDRVLLKENNEVELLDFKTGEQQSKHKKQLELYAELLTNMNYSVTAKKLVYINPTKIITL